MDLGRIASAVSTAVALGTLALVAGVAVAYLDTAESGPAVTTGLQPAAPPRPAPSPEPDPVPPAGSGRVHFDDISFTLPAGWEVRSEGDRFWRDGDDGGPPHAYRWMCVGPDGLDGACGIRLYAGDVPGRGGTRAWVDDDPWPWYQATGPLACPRPAAPVRSDDLALPAGGGRRPATRGFVPVGDRTAVYRAWAVRCSASGFTFTARAWHLPVSRVVLVDLLGQPATPALLASVRFGP